MLGAGVAVVLRILWFFGSRGYCGLLGAGDAVVYQEQGMLWFFGSRGYCGLLGAGDAVVLRMLCFVRSRECCSLSGTGGAVFCRSRCCWGFGDSVVYQKQ